MSSDWRPRDTTPSEDAQAAIVAVGAAAAVGALTYWVTKTLLGRERISMKPRAPPSGEATKDESSRIGSGTP